MASRRAWGIAPRWVRGLAPHWIRGRALERREEVRHEAFGIPWWIQDMAPRWVRGTAPRRVRGIRCVRSLAPRCVRGRALAEPGEVLEAAGAVLLLGPAQGAHLHQHAAGAADVVLALRAVPTPGPSSCMTVPTCIETAASPSPSVRSSGMVTPLHVLRTGRASLGCFHLRQRGAAGPAHVLLARPAKIALTLRVRALLAEAVIPARPADGIIVFAVGSGSR